MPTTLDPTQRLDALARRFEEGVQAHESIPNATGWSQFLDMPRRAAHTGPYGTSAGLVVLALAERGATSVSRQAANLLAHWWAQRTAVEYSNERFAQTLRLALLHLALRLSPAPESGPIDAGIAAALLERILPSGMWGNYWIDANNHDPSPRVLPSAIAVLSFTLFRPDSMPVDDRVIAVASRLEEALASPDIRPPIEVAAAAAAILATKKSIGIRRARSLVSRAARAASIDEGGSPLVYFYDFESTLSGPGLRRWRRGFFIISPITLLGIAGFQVGAPAALRLVAEEIAIGHCRNLSVNDGAYRAPGAQRLSTLDQAWTAILLSSYARRRRPVHLGGRITYALFRRRRDNWFTHRLFPVMSMIAVTIIAALPNDSSLLDRLIITIGVLFVVGLYGPAVISRLFPGRR